MDNRTEMANAYEKGHKGLKPNSKEYWNATHKTEHELKVDKVCDDTIAAIRRYINGRKKICDFGCGRGLLIREISKDDDTIKFTGIDISDYAIKKAKKAMPQHTWICDDKIVGKEYDAIICSHTIEHLPLEKTGDMIKSFIKALKKGGILVVVVPVYDIPWEEHRYTITLDGLSHFFKQFNCKWVMTYWRTMCFVHSDRSPGEEAIIWLMKENWVARPLKGC